jgi:hypothetical protein
VVTQDVYGLPETSDIREVQIGQEGVARRPTESRHRRNPTAMEWSAMTSHIPCMAHVIQLCFGAFMNSLGVKGREKSWEAHQRDKHFDENITSKSGKNKAI